MADLYPSLPQYDTEAATAILSGRTPTMGENLGAAVEEGWWGTAFGQLGAVGREVAGSRRDPTPMSREDFTAEYGASGVQWDEGMTRGRAATAAATAEDNLTRRRIMQQRDAGVMESILGFGAQIIGSAPSPENFLPIAGPLTAGARGLERLGQGLTAAGAVGGAPLAVGAGSLLARGAGAVLPGLERVGMGGAVLRGAVEGAGGNALAAPLVYAGQERYGEEATWGRFLGDIAAGAVIGSAFGGAAGVMGRYADRRAAAGLVDMAARDIEAGRNVDGAPLAMARVAEDAAVRSAPEGAAPFIRPDAAPGSRLDLPRGADGVPLSRAEFAALAERERLTQPAMLHDLDRRDAQEAAGAPHARSVTELLAAIRRGEDRPTGEKTLAQFVVEQGGIRDERGDVRNMMGAGNKTRPGLMSGRGLPVDEMAEKARAAGYFPEFGERESAGAVGEDGFGLRAFIEALDEDLNKTRVRVGETENRTAREIAAAAGDLDGLLERNGASINDKPERVLEVLRGLREDAPLRSLDDLLRDDAAYSWYRGALDAQKRAEAMTSLRTDPETIPAKEGASDDADTAYLEHQVAALDAEGRLTPEDKALLRQGDEAVAAAEADARALDEAAACTLRNMA